MATITLEFLTIRDLKLQLTQYLEELSTEIPYDVKVIATKKQVVIATPETITSPVTQQAARQETQEPEPAPVVGEMLSGPIPTVDDLRAKVGEMSKTHRVQIKELMAQYSDAEGVSGIPETKRLDFLAALTLLASLTIT